MLPKQNHLSRILWETLKKKQGSRSVFNTLGTLKYYPKDTTHLAVVVSSKHEKKAVSRNKLKRRINTIFSKNYKTLKGVFIVFPSKQAYNLSYEAIRQQAEELFNKIT